MYCPVCRAEYREGFTRCSDCDTDLVASLAPPPPSDDLAIAWRGSDPALFSAALAALQNAAIRNYQIADHDNLAWELAIPRPRYSIWVLKRDLEKALALVGQMNERPAFAFGETPEWAQTEDRSGESDDSVTDMEPDIDTDETTVEVWSAADPPMANTLKDCLHENGIACLVQQSGENCRILVRPKAEKRAREIVREVIEGTPPE
jgi:hypothetical protein